MEISREKSSPLIPSSRDSSLPTLDESLILPEPTLVQVSSSVVPFITGSASIPSDVLLASSTETANVKLPAVPPR